MEAGKIKRDYRRNVTKLTLPSWNRFLLEKLIAVQRVQIFSAFYGNPRYNFVVITPK